MISRILIVFKSKLLMYEGEEHGFFNYYRKLSGAFIHKVNKMDNFLVELGYILTHPKSILK